jgi:hypothetical protein
MKNERLQACQPPRTLDALQLHSKWQEQLSCEHPENRTGVVPCALESVLESSQNRTFWSGAHALWHQARLPCRRHRRKLRSQCHHKPCSHKRTAKSSFGELARQQAFPCDTKEINAEIVLDQLPLDLQRSRAPAARLFVWREEELSGEGNEQNAMRTKARTITHQYSASKMTQLLYSGV